MVKNVIILKIIICNNFNNHFSSVAERIIKHSNLNASTEKLDNWVSSKLWLENTFSYIGILPEEVLRDGPFNLQGRLCFFFFLNILIPNVAEKNILILVEEKNNNLIQSFCHITYVKFWKKISRFALQKK